MKDDRFDLEGELRAGRSRPRAEFTSELAGGVREASGRARQSRAGLMLALAGLVTVAVASFGGVGYASSNKPSAPKHTAVSAAGAQYTPFTPPQAKPKAKPKVTPAAVTPAAVTPAAAPKAVTKAAVKTQVAPKASQLPFTGLTLWVPLAAGFVLIALGLALRLRGRRRDSPAH